MSGRCRSWEGIRCNDSRSLATGPPGRRGPSTGRAGTQSKKTLWHLVWLQLRADEPRTPAQSTAVVGVSVITARAVPHRCNGAGPAGLTDRRAGNRRRPRLTNDQRAALFTALIEAAPDGGLWTGPKVVAYVRHGWGVAVRSQTLSLIHI